LALWEGSMTWCGGVATSAKGEVAPRREKGGDDASWAAANLTEAKNKENSCGRFNCYNWMVKI
jgi:hypothetical protein